MTSSIEEASEPIAPEAAESKARLEAFLSLLANAKQSCLLLDYDGTLAPFRVDAAKARPWAGVEPLVDAIGECQRARIVFVTGRPAHAAARLLKLKRNPEIWGLHGAEHLMPDGSLERMPLEEAAMKAIEDARKALEAANLPFRMEHKPNSVGVHWRGKALQSSQAAQGQAEALMQQYTNVPTVKLLKFNGGLELRAGNHKGDAVRAIQAELPHDSAIAYLGDDTTDEDAFVALGNAGLSVLVRQQWRPTAAQVWIRPPDDLRRFLRRWKNAVCAPASDR
jgi:trehalose-phosphatase